MPFKCPIKKKAYYERHKKHYDAEWVNKNRERWYAYNRENARKNKIKKIESLKNAVKELNIDDENSPTFCAAVVALMINGVKMFKYYHLAKRLGYELGMIKTFVKNWQQSGLIKEGVFVFEEWNTDLEFIVSLTVASLCATGEIVAYHEKNQQH